MAAGTGKLIWVGRVISGLVSAMFLMSGIMKLVGGAQLTEGMAHLGLPEKLILPLAFIELTCVALYMIPQTTVLGAILLTGYLGGAICTHVRIDEPVFVHIGLGIAVWLGICFRDSRLWHLIPLRKL